MAEPSIESRPRFTSRHRTKASNAMVIGCLPPTYGVVLSCRCFAVVAVWLCAVPMSLGGEVPPPRAELLVIEFEYVVRQEIAVREGSDFVVITDTEGGRLRATGRVGYVSGDHVHLDLRLHGETTGGYSQDMNVSRRLRLGEFGECGVGALPMGYVLGYVWIRRGVDPVPALVEALRRRDGNAGLAVRHLARLKEGARVAVPELIELLKPEVPVGLRELAATALGQIGPKAKDAVPALTGLLKNDQPGDVRVAVAVALWKIAKHPTATQTLLAAADESERRIRLKALDALCEMGVEAPAAGSNLVAMLDETDPQIRAKAAGALWATTRDTRAVDTLLDMLESDAPGYAGVEEELGLIGYPSAHIATKAVASNAFSEHSGTRWWVADTLARIDPDASHCFPLLLQTFREKEGRGVKELSEVLARFGATIVPRLNVLLDSEDAHSIELALTTLARIGAWKTVAAALGHANPEVRRRAAAMRPPEPQRRLAVPDLIRGLGDEEERVRRAVGRALREIGPASIPALEQAIENGNLQTRELAHQILDDIETRREDEAEE